jgi:hypothetical protein
LPISCSTVHLFIFIIMSVYMWNKFFSCITACSTTLAQSKEGSMERKLSCSIQDVPSFGILLSHMPTIPPAFLTDHCKRFNVVVTYLNKYIIITKSPIRTEVTNYFQGTKTNW